MWSPLRHETPPTHPEEDASGLQCFARLRQGDPEALDRLLAVYWHPLVSYAVHLTRGSTDAAEDLVQEAFVRLWERHASFREGSLPAPVLYTIVRNLCSNHCRTRRTRGLILRSVRFPTATTHTPADEYDGHQLEESIRDAIDALPARRREVFILARFHGLSYAEIAELMSLTPQTVANQMSSAISALRATLHALEGEPEIRP
jgi:RNA polymerase sigma-70 factor, ECF subfamily